MLLLHTSDLHGNEEKYNKIRSVATREKAGAIVLAGDICSDITPINGLYEWLSGWFSVWVQRVVQEGIHLICVRGNHDPNALDHVMESLSASSGMVHWVDRTPLELNGYTFVGMSEVKDLPHSVKDRARLDYSEKELDGSFQPPNFFISTEVDGEYGWIKYPIEEWAAHVSSLPKLYDILWHLPVDDWSKAVLVAHGPPFGLGLDVLPTGEQVGSIALTDFIEDNQPYLTLHGHIHNSPNQTNIRKATINKSLCVQMGQLWHHLEGALIDLETLKVRRVLEKVRR